MWVLVYIGYMGFGVYRIYGFWCGIYATPGEGFCSRSRAIIHAVQAAAAADGSISSIGM